MMPALSYGDPREPGWALVQNKPFKLFQREYSKQQQELHATVHRKHFCQIQSIHYDMHKGTQ